MYTNRNLHAKLTDLIVCYRLPGNIISAVKFYQLIPIACWINRTINLVHVTSFLDTVYIFLSIYFIYVYLTVKLTVKWSFRSTEKFILPVVVIETKIVLQIWGRILKNCLCCTIRLEGNVHRGFSHIHVFFPKFLLFHLCIFSYDPLTPSPSNPQKGIL